MTTRITILEEGYKIHLKSVQGMYTIVKVFEDGVAVTCAAWQARNNYPKFIVWKLIPYDDVKCIAGGRHAPNQLIKFEYNKGRLA